MACEHIDTSELRPPRANQSVYREDCTQCFDSIDDPSGLNVCLSCFNGGCTGERDHASLHNQMTGHPLVLNIRRTKKAIHREEPPQKMSRLAINAETEEDRYDTKIQLKCYTCGIENVDKAAGKLPGVVDGIMQAMTFAKQEEVKAWEQEFTPCEHTLCLEQQPSKQIESQDLGKCSMCDLKENLWLCLECGNLGCGRAQFAGGGGNSHGLAHTDSTSHAVAVKLGSITPEGSADVYCYKCNEERIDTELAGHLSHWGIKIAEREKTEKSLMEMQVEQNLKYDFSMTTEDGEELKPLFGKGFTGLKNIGNSCYLASIIQCLFSLPNFQDRYFHPHDLPPTTANPAEDLETQLRKLADGLISGRYSYPDTNIHALPDNSEVPNQKGLSPAMFKHLIGRGHEEFSTMRQQDAFELLLHLFKLINLSQPDPSQDPIKDFRFVMEQRLQCLKCKKVRYRSDEQDNISIPVPVRRRPSGKVAETTKGWEFEPVTLKECLDIFTTADMVELTCPSCSSKDGFSKQSKFKTFPQNLAINARRFELVNWVPTKLDVPVQVSDESFDMGLYHSNGLQPGEEELPEDASVSAGAGSQPGFTPNAEAMAQLESMGFGRNRCQRALQATGNEDTEAAMNWLFGHMDDPDIDDPLVLVPSGAGGSASAPADPAKIAQLGDMGIPAPQARKALRECAGDVNRALDWVFSHPDDAGDIEGSGGEEARGATAPTRPAGSADLPARFELQSIVCHKGASIHAGHYVAFIRKHIDGEGRQWVLYNDEKVVKAADVEEMKKFAYVYFFRRA